MIILTVAFIIGLASTIVYLGSNSEESENFKEVPQSTSNPSKILVDVSGSVNKPDLYEASNYTRLKEIIKKAGGLSETADKNFFGRNFNLARIINDQEKIYIPSVWEVSNGYFIESQQTLNYSSPAEIPLTGTREGLVNINKASLEELDKLPGVGKIIGQKIIEARPFKALQELIDKKVVGKNVYENLKDLIQI